MALSRSLGLGRLSLGQATTFHKLWPQSAPFAGLLPTAAGFSSKSGNSQKPPNSLWNQSSKFLRRHVDRLKPPPGILSSSSPPASRLENYLKSLGCRHRQHRHHTLPSAEELATRAARNRLIARILVTLGVAVVASPFVQRALTGDYPRWATRNEDPLIHSIIEDAEELAVQPTTGDAAALAAVVAAGDAQPAMVKLEELAEIAEEQAATAEKDLDGVLEDAHRDISQTLQDWQISGGPQEWLVYLGRTLRITSVVALTVLDYKLNLWFLDEDTQPEAWAEARAVVDQRCARRLRKLCTDYGGIFIKAAQMLSTMGHVLPLPYVQEFSALQDGVPPSPIEAINASFLQEFGQLPVDLFLEFDLEPVASASIAQVHRARRKDGTQVAVKVQYPHIYKQMEHALRTLRPQLQYLGKLFPKYDMTFILQEFRSTMIQELDFLNEADNARRIATLFEDREDIYVPWTDPQLSSQRILTMEWVTGVKVDQAEQIRERLGLEPLEVADLLVRSFSEMMFRFGFVHADPQPGNVWVSRTKAGRPMLILLDHGLYQELDPAFRINYCRLWRSFFKQDSAEMEDSARALGLEKYAPYLPLMLTFRPMKGGGKLGQMEQMEMVRLMKDAFMDFNASQFLQSLPPDLLFLLKVNHLVRHANRQLGGTTRRRLRLTFRAAVQGLYSTPRRIYDPLLRQKVEHGAQMSLGQCLGYAADMTLLEVGFQLFENQETIASASRVIGGSLAVLGVIAWLWCSLRGRWQVAGTELPERLPGNLMLVRREDLQHLIAQVIEWEGENLR